MEKATVDQRSPAHQSESESCRQAHRGPTREHGRVTLRLAGLVLATATLVVLLGDTWSASTLAHPSSLVERQRFGFVTFWPDWRERFDVAQLGAGWYTEAASRACAVSPEGMDRAAAILLRNYAGIPSWLGSRIDSHPGTLWLIGNEPDCIYQDNVLPEDYAHIYHELYTFIKDRDPTSQVSPGGIVQPTPLRLEWLDRVLAEYQLAYTETMPVDVWNIHNAILQEVSCEHNPLDCWGCEIPPGIDADVGVQPAPEENDNMVIFEEQIWAFRQWMADNGYGGYPLIVSEYGILMWAELGFPAARVNAFMSATFQFFQTARDPDLGDPTDDYRLVQRWAWFSLDFPPYSSPDVEWGLNGNLFDPETGVITEMGLHYADYTSDFPSLDYVDLSPGRFSTPLVSGPAGSTQVFTQTIEFEILNEGSQESGAFMVDLHYDGPASGELDQSVANVPPASSAWITFALTSVPRGQYELSVSIDPDDQVVESTECNNQATTVIRIPPYVVYLPLVSR